MNRANEHLANRRYKYCVEQTKRPSKQDIDLYDRVILSECHTQRG